MDAIVASGLAAGALVGSAALMPGFVAFPLADILLGRGVGVMAMAATHGSRRR
jgi:GrpB-like predicted nucleotidyltransferase (UPF0157 family)